MSDDYTTVIELGSGVFGVKALVGDHFVIVAYVVVVPPIQPNLEHPAGVAGTETWYTVAAHNDYAGHADWGDHFPYSGRHPKDIRFDWLQESTAWTPPVGSGKPTYFKWVHAVAPFTSYP